MSPLSAPEYVMSSLAEATHKMVCRSPVFPKIPRFGVRALPHRDQNCEHKRRRSGRRRGDTFLLFEARSPDLRPRRRLTMDLVSKAHVKSEGRG